MSVTDRVNGAAPTDPAVLRAEIAATRAQLGETVEALAMKTDVKARTTDALRQTVADAKGRGRGAVDQARQAIGQGRRSLDRDRRAFADRAAQTMRRPIAIWMGAGIGATMGGVAAAMWVQRRRSQQVVVMTRWQVARARLGR